MVVDRKLLGKAHTLSLVMDGYKGDTYLLVEGALVKLFQWPDCEDKYIPLEDGSMILYQEHLDGPLVSLADAMSRYPEMFI